MDYIFHLLSLVLQPDVILSLLGGMVLGIFVGAAPGLTATMATALLVPITYYMSPLAGLALIVSTVFSSIFAGDIPATYLRIPGTPASGAAVLDGYPMTQKGQGSLALSIDLTCSVLGGIFGVIILVGASTLLAKIALQFTDFEYFWLAVFGLAISAVIARGRALKGMISVILGLFVSTVGLDIVSGYPRFTFGNVELLAGISFIPAMMGLFGVSEVLKQVTNPEELKLAGIQVRERITWSSIWNALRAIRNNLVLFLRSSILGVFVGALPGAGADMAAWVSYGIAKRTSKHPEKFGTGCVEGVMAPTAANNAALGGTWIPALTLGIPGDSVTAIVLGAALIYGLRPGPLVFQQSGDLVYSLFLVAFLAQLALFIVGFIGIRTFTLAFKLPRNLLMPAIFVFSVVGSYALRNTMLDVLTVLFFGLLGFVLEKKGYPLAPLILGIILGPLIEQHLRVGLIKTGGSLLPFFTRPIAAVLLFTILLFLAGPYLMKFLKQLQRRIKKEEF